MNIIQKVDALNEIFADDDQVGTGVALITVLPAFLLALSGLDKEVAKQGMSAMVEDVSELIDQLDTSSIYDA